MTGLVLNDGRRVDVRPIEPTDKQALADAFGRLSTESRYRRFLGARGRLSTSTLRYFTEVDHHDHEALVAFDPSGALVGVARYVRLAERLGTAELAVTIADEWQSDGLGTALVALLIDRARAEGIEAFSGEVLSHNRRMVDLLREYGAPHLESCGDGVEDFALPLPATAMAPHIPELLASAAAHSPGLGPRPSG